MVKNLFVGSLPFTIGEDALGQLFRGVGQVQSVNIIKDKFSGSSRGFAFVEMATEEDAKNAIEKLNGYELEGRKMIVKEALPKPTYTDGRSSMAGRGRGGFGGGSGHGGGGRRY